MFKHSYEQDLAKEAIMRALRLSEALQKKEPPEPERTMVQHMPIRIDVQKNEKRCCKQIKNIKNKRKNNGLDLDISPNAVRNTFIVSVVALYVAPIPQV